MELFTAPIFNFNGNVVGRFLCDISLDSQSDALVATETNYYFHH